MCKKKQKIGVKKQNIGVKKEKIAVKEKQKKFAVKKLV